MSTVLSTLQHRLSLVCLFGFCVVIAAGEVSADVDSTFTVPPYKLNDTVIGIQGWEMRFAPDSPVYTDPMAAQVVKSPVLKVQQPTTLALATAIKKKVGYLDKPYKLETAMAITYDYRYYHGGGVYFQFSASATYSPFNFGFDYGQESGGGGFYYQGDGERVVVLPRHLIAENTMYHWEVRVNPRARTFRVLVTGADNRGQPFRHESGDLRFNEKYEERGRSKEIFIGNDRPTTVKSYIDYVKIMPQ
jgi:hypothetical protein